MLSWNVAELDDINEQSLSLFSILDPKIDILVVGIGDKTKSYDFSKKLIPLAKNLKMSFEMLATEHACTTFNFLNAEGRNVAAALIPPQHFELTDDDILQSKLRYENLYEDR